MAEKHGKSHFGDKLSTHLDRKYTFSRKIAIDTFGTHEIQHFYALITPTNMSRDVDADPDYPSAGCEAEQQAQPYPAPYQMQVGRIIFYSKPSKRRKCRIAKTRFWDEHVSRAGKRELRDDGCLLQPETAGLLQEGRNCCLLIPKRVEAQQVVATRLPESACQNMNRMRW